MLFVGVWNWVENYPDEFTKLYQIPQTDMVGKDNVFKKNSYLIDKNLSFSKLFFCYYGAFNLFNLCQIEMLFFSLYLNYPQPFSFEQID